MAIVKTTTRDTTNSTGTPPDSGNGTTGNGAAPVDRTKSVVNQGGTIVRPAPRSASGARTPLASQRAAAPRSGSFIQETRVELQKVVWPSRDDVQAGTIVTILLLIVFGAYIFGLDAFFSWLFHVIGLYPNNVAT